MKSKSNIKAAKGVNLPNLRYVDDYLRLLKEMDSDVDDIGQLLDKQAKLLTSTLIVKAQPVKAAVIFDVTPTRREDQNKEARKLRTRIDPSIENVQVPNLKKLQSHYALAEELYERHRSIESMEAQLEMQFPTRRGEAYNETLQAMQRLRAKIAGHLKTALDFLSTVADKHVPQQFVKYNAAVAALVEEHCIYKSANSFMYVSVDDEGYLLFTNYLMLTKVVNDEGDVAPHLYISIQWHLNTEPSIRIDLNHEYELPNKLIGSGEAIGSVGEAARALKDMLTLESFSSALGVVPLALQLKVSPEKLSSEMFSYRDVIDKVIVDTNSISFKLRKEVNTDAFEDEVAYRLWKELKALTKSRDVKVTYERDTINGIRVLTFKIVTIAKGGSLNTTDIEFLRDRFGLSNGSLNKIARIINGD